MDAWEFDLWWREYRRNPWGEHRDEAHARLVAMTVANSSGKTRKEDAQLSDFALKFGTTKHEPAEQAEPDPATFFKPFVY